MLKYKIVFCFYNTRTVDNRAKVVPSCSFSLFNLLYVPLLNLHNQNVIIGWQSCLVATSAIIHWLLGKVCLPARTSWLLDNCPSQVNHQYNSSSSTSSFPFFVIDVICLGVSPELKRWLYLCLQFHTNWILASFQKWYELKWCSWEGKCGVLYISGKSGRDHNSSHKIKYSFFYEAMQAFV